MPETREIREVTECNHECHQALHEETHEALRILRKLDTLVETIAPVLSAYGQSPAAGLAALRRLRKGRP